MIKNSTSEKKCWKKKKINNKKNHQSHQRAKKRTIELKWINLIFNIQARRTWNIKNQIGRTKFVILNPFIKIFYLNTECLYKLFQK